MKSALRFLPAVEEDAAVAYEWYENRDPGLGEEFESEFFAGASRISRNPLLYPEIKPGFRRILLHRFPYALYFKIEGDLIIVFGLFHCARDPRQVRRRLTRRKTPATFNPKSKI